MDILEVFNEFEYNILLKILVLRSNGQTDIFLDHQPNLSYRRNQHILYVVDTRNLDHLRISFRVCNIKVKKDRTCILNTRKYFFLVDRIDNRRQYSRILELVNYMREDMETEEFDSDTMNEFYIEIDNLKPPCLAG